MRFVILILLPLVFGPITPHGGSPAAGDIKPSTSPTDEALAPTFEMVGKSFVALRVEDVDEAAAWYLEAFGLTDVNRIDAEDGRYSIRIFDSPGLSLELIQAVGVNSVTDPHLGFFKKGFYVDDIEAAHEWFRARGVRTDQGYFIDEALSAASFVTRDPFGNRLQFFSSCGDDCQQP